MSIRSEQRVRAVAAAAVAILSTGISVGAGAEEAQPLGAILDPGDLGPARAEVEARIAAARKADPRMFAVVGEQLSMERGKLAVARRSRSQNPAALGVRLRRLGAPARWALVDALAFHSPVKSGTDAATWKQLQLSLLDALGASAGDGDGLLGAVLGAAFQRTRDVDLRGAAAVGLGALGEAGLPTLLAHAQEGDPALLPAVRGLAASRRPRALNTLAALLSSSQSEPEAQALAAALGEAASSWALGTGQQASLAEAAEMRRVAAGALIVSYPRWDGTAARQIEASLRRIAHPDTARLIDQAREQAPAQAAKYRQLLATLAK